MSLAPQRPNFVLVWIGIVLLTFSFISNFLAGGSDNESSTADGRATLGDHLVLEDASTLPGLGFTSSTEADAVAAPALFEMDKSDPRVLDDDHDTPLADNGSADATTGDQDVEFPLELKEVAEQPELEAEETAIGGLTPVAPMHSQGVQTKAVEPASERGVNRAGKPSVRRGKTFQATYGGPNAQMGRSLAKTAKGFDKPGLGIQVKTKLTESGHSGTVIVSFLLSHPQTGQNLRDRLDTQEIDPKIRAAARALIRDVQQADQDAVDAEAEEDREEDLADSEAASERRDLLRMLRLHPGAIEIIAELTPAQLQELANKFGARSQKLRALVQ
jgi:hypothetical protein